MEAIFSVFQSLLLIFLPMAPVSMFPTGSEVVIKNWKNPVNSKDLSQVVTNSLVGTKGKYHIYIRHLATGESYAKEQNEVMLSASLYKSWLAVGVLDEIRLGRLKDGQVLSESIAKLNRWAGLKPGQAELTKGQAKYSVSEALKLMIGVSHNYSAFLLTREVGNSKVQKILKAHGLSEVKFVRPPTVTASAMSLFLEKVYRGRFFSDQAFSKRLKDILAGNQLNDGLPKLLPEGTRVEHKTGELDNLKHDCGIVYSRGGDYIICVMTDTDDPLAAEARIADISLAVYNYFNK